MIEDNIKKIKQEIDNLKTSILYNPQLQIIAVSKYASPKEIITAIDSGIDNFGENYLKDIQIKWPQIQTQYPNIKLHFIGHLQSNKIKKILQYCYCIHSVSSIKQINIIKQWMLENNNPQKEFFLQVKFNHGELKNGIILDSVDQIISYCKEINFIVNGFMFMIDDNNLEQFNMAYQLSKQYHFTQISMGMSNDYVTAIQYGSSHIRIGTKIFKV